MPADSAALQGVHGTVHVDAVPHEVEKRVGRLPTVLELHVGDVPLIQGKLLKTVEGVSIIEHAGSRRHRVDTTALGHRRRITGTVIRGRRNRGSAQGIGQEKSRRHQRQKSPLHFPLFFRPVSFFRAACAFHKTHLSA